jgi:hypothetical protein
MRQILTLAALVFLLTATAAGQTSLESSWIGGPGADRLTGAAVLPDGVVVVVGTVPGADPKLTPALKPTGRAGDGLLMRLSASTGEALALVRQRGPLSAMVGDDVGNLYVAGPSGCALLDAVGQARWINDLGAPEARIVPGPSRSAILLTDKTITVLTKSGSTFKSWKVEADVVTDVACDPAEQLVFVTGYDTRKDETGPVQVAFVYAYDGNAKLVWKAYGWTAADLKAQGLTGDTRGCRLALGPNHKLYVAGEGKGPATLWTRQPQDLAAKQALSDGDKFQNAADAGTIPVAFLVRLDGLTGKSEAATALVSRLQGGAAGDVRPRALAVDEVGRVYVGGAAAGDTPVSDGAPQGKAGGGGAFLMIFDGAFKRLYAAKPAGTGQTHSIAVGLAYVVAVGEGKEDLAPLKAPQKAYGGGESDGWYFVMNRTNLPVPFKGQPPVPAPLGPGPEKPGPEKPAPGKAAGPAPAPTPPPKVGG